jgi:hypothetical protein
MDVETGIEEHETTSEASQEANYLEAFGEKPEAAKVQEEEAATPEAQVEPEPEPVVSEPESIEAKFERLLDERVEKFKQEWVEKYEAREQKLTGRMGDFNTKLTNLQASRQKFNPSEIKFTQLAELLGDDTAEALTKDLSAAFQPDPESVQAFEKMQHEMQMQQTKALISYRHKDWESVVESPEFAQWRDNLTPEVRADVLSTNDAGRSCDYIDQFKEFQKVASEPSYINWVKQAGITLPSDLAVKTYESWKLLGAEPGFVQWAENLTDGDIRYKIGRESDPLFIASAGNAFAQFRKANPEPKQENKVVQPKAVDRLASQVVPKTSTDSASTGDSKMEAYLAAFS